MSPTSAKECINFALRPPPPPAIPNAVSVEPITLEEISYRVFEVPSIKRKLHALIFPSTKASLLFPFWQNTGTGITTRLAAEVLDNIDTLQETKDFSASPFIESDAHVEIKERISTLLQREARVTPQNHHQVSREDVFLFQTGMTSIYHVHKYLLSSNSCSQKTTLFGFAFHSTLHIFEDFGPGYKLFGRGTDDELEPLERFLKTENAEGRKLQAIWCEFPTNPNLTVPNISRLRALANEYDTLLIVDDTIGSFCNVDLFGTEGADILVSSLTKSFSRKANVMGGSAVLNPLRPRYAELKKLFDQRHENGYSDLDTEVLASNSRTYLATSQKCQKITTDLVSFLQGKANSPSSAIKSVLYPTTNPESLTNYDPWKRPNTNEFTTGYGCLFSLEFESVEKMKIFYEAVQVHIGPHFGATRTLMFAYVKGLYGAQLEWIGKFGLRENMMRVAPGLEEDLVQVFEEAVNVMDGVSGMS